MKKIFPSLLFSLLSLSILAQTGIVTGKIIDEETGEPVLFANVIIDGTTTGATSDMNGKYRLEVPAGTVDLRISFVSYTPKVIKGIEVKDNEVVTQDIFLSSSTTQLDEFVVEAQKVERTEVALLKMKQKSVNVMDGVSAQEIQNSGSGNSAEAMKQVTGASVEDGKYVVVRGLGDRYSISQLNGVTLPSTDPYRNSTSMDLIPANAIDNVVALKTFTPDQPGNFTGGNVNIKTKSIPDQYFVTASVGLAYNTVSSLNKNFLTDPATGKYDRLGYDDGTRDVPRHLQSVSQREQLSTSLYLAARQNSEGTVAESEFFDQSAKSFTNSFVPERRTSGLNQSYSVSVGNRKKLFGRDFGFTVSGLMSQQYTVKEDWELNINRYSGSGSDKLFEDFGTSGSQGTYNPRVGGFASAHYEISDRSELGLELLYNHSTEYKAGFLKGQYPQAISGNHTLYTRNINPVERGLFTTMLTGEHVLPVLNETRVNWVASRSSGQQVEPDIRIFADFTRTLNGEENYIINDNELQLPFHVYRDLDDTQYNGQVDFETPIGNSKKSKLKYGGLYQTKSRSFEELRFQLSANGSDPDDPDYLSYGEAGGDFDAFFAPGNAGILGQDPNNPARNRLGNSYVNQSRKTNLYEGRETFAAAYLMGVVQLSPTWKFIGGARMETTNILVQSGDGSIGSIDTFDVLPSLGIIKEVNERSNIRLNLSQTLARPNMRELAPFNSIDFIGGYFYLGNPDLEKTSIYNADLRYEYYPNPGEMFAVSGFGKHFTNPIMKQLTPIASGGEIQFVNVDEAYLLGLELEARKTLAFIAPALKDFKVSTNFTYTYSRVDLPPAEYETYAKINPDLKPYRPFQAQSPFLANLMLTYTADSAGLTVSAFANVYGRRLIQNGFGGAPDVYEIRSNGNNNVPTPDANLRVSKKIGGHWNLSLQVENIFNARYVSNQAFQGRYYTVEGYNVGRTFGMKLQYSL